MTTFLLVDNGSKRAAATLQLHHIAQQLSDRSNQYVYPVSLQHASAIPAEALGGTKAIIFVDFLRQKLTEGERVFRVLPLFFGNSRALTGFIPEQQALLVVEFGVFELTIADVLYPLPIGDARLAEIVYANIQQTAQNNALPLQNIVLVDHGSPLPQVTQVRKGVTEAVQAKLNYVSNVSDSASDIELAQTAMERRVGRKYDFNGILLEDWLIDKAKQGEQSAIVALLFLLPGRHAGEEGDIVTICASVMQHYPDFTIAISPLVGEHAILLDILHERLVS